jgi:hypothetical protein
MALVVKDRVRETSTSTGTGTITLNGAVAAFQSFAVIGNGNTTYYTIVDAVTGAWEVGIGTYTSSGTLLSRDTILESSNAGSAVDFAAGVKDVFCTYPAERSIYTDAAGSAITPATASALPAVSGGTGLTSPGTSGNVLTSNGTTWASSALPDVGDVDGPASATDNAIARYDGTTGKIIQNSSVTIADDGATVIAANSTSDGLRITQVGTGNALLVEDSANPDATPFVVTSIGTVGIGVAAPENALHVSGQGIFDRIGTTSASQPQQINQRRKRDADAILVNGDDISILSSWGWDGASFVQATSILSEVDGTPGTNDMPGRLVFSTTADGASSPTERMRIDSAGRFGFNATTGGGGSGLYRFGGTATGATDINGLLYTPTIASDVTSSVTVFASQPATTAASFTLGFLSHFSSNQGTLGATSAINNQYGFIAQSTLTGATNNYGFFGNIASGTGRYNFYAAGSADNYFAGNVLVGSTSTTNDFRVDIAPPAAGTALRIRAGSSGISFLQFTDNNLTAQWGFFETSVGSLNIAHSDVVRVTTNSVERMRIDSAGRVGIGAIPAVDVSAVISRNITGAVNQYVVASNGTVQSDVTGQANYFFSNPKTQAAAFTLTNLRHFFSSQGSFGASSVVTNQFGFAADSNLTGATNNYGFFSNIASGTGRWNFYAAGTALNYFAGNVGIGTATPSTALHISSSTAFTPELRVENTTSDANAAYLALQKSRSGGVVSSGDRIGTLQFKANDGISAKPAAEIIAAVDGTPGADDMPGRLVFATTADGASSSTERMRIDSAGQVGIGTGPTASVTLDIAKVVGIGAGTAYGVWSRGATAPTTTSSSSNYVSTVSTASNGGTGYTVTTLVGFRAIQGTLNADSTVTNQYGFIAQNTLTGAINNYGFISDIASGTGRWNFYAAGSAANYFAGDMQLDKTVTAGGTTGAQTINKNAGTVNFAAAATSLVVTDSRVTTSSIIICTVGTNDTTLKSVAAVAGAGSFTLHASAAATAETRVNFLIIN